MSFVRRFFCAISILYAATAAAEVPHVVVTIPPVHSLATRVMKGVASPSLLLDGGASPHQPQLRPSQLKTLHQADLIVWIGPALESFLQRPLHNRKQGLLQLDQLPTLQRWPQRTDWLSLAANDEDEDHHHNETAHHNEDEDHHNEDNLDPHLWLDPVNARKIVEALAQRLSAIDPAHKAHYQRNATATIAALQDLETELHNSLQGLQQHAFIAFHDAFQYFERRFGLKTQAVVMRHTEYSPGPRYLLELRATIRRDNIPCLFAEPQFNSRLLATVTEGLSIRTSTLDPLGNLSEGDAEGGYERLLRHIGENFKACLTLP